MRRNRACHSAKRLQYFSMGRLLHAMACAALVLGGSSAFAAQERGQRDGFVVEPFVNVKKARVFEHLSYGLPALLAERFGEQAPPLRFEGGAVIFARGTGAPAKWIVGGSYERKADWSIAVTVEVKKADAPAEVLARATRSGGKDDVVRTALEAAAAALAELPEGALAADKLPPAVMATFARDPYAFVLYGRGLAAYQGAASSAVRTEHAVALLKRALLIDPKVPEVRRLLAEVHLAAGRPGHARAMLAYALDLRPDYGRALRTLAALDRAAGMPVARQRYARVLELDPDDVDARRAYGELLADAGLMPEAQKELEAVLQAAPDDLGTRRRLVLVLAARHAGRELCAALEEILKLDPEDLEARMDLGAGYLSLGMKPEAAATYDEVLRRRPRHAGALKLAGDLARDRGDIKQAAAYYTKLRAVSPQDPRPVFLMAAAHAEAGDLDAAARLYGEAARFPGMVGDAYSNLGALALRRGQPKQALWFLSQAVKKRPEKATVRYNHALALHRLGRNADALNELHAAETADPNDAGVKFLAGVVALRLGFIEEAVASFRGAVALDPNFTDARHNLALLETLTPKNEGDSSLSLYNAN
jgi:tetratricopeptide (TPR) repeat protein